MKHMAKLLTLLMILMLLPLTAQADKYVVDETTFNKTCKWRMTTSSTLYRENRQEVDGQTVYTYEPVGTLAAGKYIVWILRGEVPGKIMVRYWNGKETYGWIDDGTYAWYTRTICTATGRKTTIPALAYGDEAAVRYVLSEFCTAEEIEQYIEGMRQGITTEKDENGEIIIVKEEPLTPPTVTLQRDDETAVEVEVVLPGTANSTIRLDGEEMTVPTAALSWENDGAEHTLARVYAPKNGVASVYARDEGKGGVIKKFKTGSIVLVLGQSGKYTKVYGEETVGYVITSALEFYDPYEAPQMAVLKQQAYLRLVARENGYKLTVLPEGTEVAVVGEQGQWAEVEYEGFVGYVEQNKLK